MILPTTGGEHSAATRRPTSDMKQTLTAAQIRALIEAQPQSSNRQRVAALSERSGISTDTLYRYMRNGLPPRVSPLILRTLQRMAAETGVTETDESITGVFL